MTGAAASFYFDLQSPLAYLAAERVLHVRPGPARWQPVLALQPLRWPDPFPFDSELAMRVATYAKSIGRAVPFAQAAFRQAFAGGRSLHVGDNVLIAAAACEMHPAAVRAALRRAAPARQLREQTARAAALGVRDVPAVSVGERVFWGERELERAAAYMREQGEAGRQPSPPRTAAVGA